MSTKHVNFINQNDNESCNYIFQLIMITKQNLKEKNIPAVSLLFLLHQQLYPENIKMCKPFSKFIFCPLIFSKNKIKHTACQPPLF